MLNDAKYKNAFVSNDVILPEPSDCTVYEENGRLRNEKVSPLNFHHNYQVKHECKTIILPLLEEQQYATAPLLITYKPEFTSFRDIWDYATVTYTKWSQYPAEWANTLSEYIRYYLADKNYLNITKKGIEASKGNPGMVVGFATHAHLSIVAIATSTAVAICSVPLLNPVPKLLYHERIRGIKAIAFRPNAGNTIAVGYDEGIAIFTQKDEMVAKWTCMEGYHEGSNAWVSFYSDARLGPVSSLSWDTYGECLLAGSAKTGKVGVWKLLGKQFSVLSYTGPVEYVLWSPFDDFFFTSHAGGILNFWDKSNKQEIIKMDSRAAAFSPDGKYVAIATQTNLYIYNFTHDKKDIVKCVFIEPSANTALFKNKDTKIELGEIENVAWSHDGERLAISFSALPVVALYAVRKLNDSFALLVVGYVNSTSYSPDITPFVTSIAFLPYHDRGSLLCVCYSDAIVTFTPLHYQSITQPLKTQRIFIPSVRPIVLSQPPSSTPHSTPLPLPAPSLSPSPSISGHILSPAKSPGYKVLFQNRTPMS